MHSPSKKILTVWRSGKKIGTLAFTQKSVKSFIFALTHGVQRRKYTLQRHILESVDSAKYLGVHLSQDMTWQTHLNRTAAKASSTLGFLRRNLHSCTQDVCERTYNTFILPTLNYASAAWDPYPSRDVDQLEKVQRCGARYMKKKLSREITLMCHQHVNRPAVAPA